MFDQPFNEIIYIYIYTKNVTIEFIIKMPIEWIMIFYINFAVIRKCFYHSYPDYITAGTIHKITNFIFFCLNR